MRGIDYLQLLKGRGLVLEVALTKFTTVLLANACLLISPSCVAQTRTGTPAVVAFPGAEGAGAQSLGGRGGRVIVVTSLADSGPGTLRAAVMAKGPRTVVFAVAGTIALAKPIKISEPRITIAGQIGRASCRERVWTVV